MIKEKPESSERSQVGPSYHKLAQCKDAIVLLNTDSLGMYSPVEAVDLGSLRCGQADEESTALTEAALYPDSSLVGFDDLSSDDEP